jgi:hypothetical protein
MSEYERIVNEVNQILAEYSIPLTLRQIYYRLVSKGVIPNTKTSYKTLSKILVKARERGEIDDSKIEDRSREVLGQGDWGYWSLESFLEERIERLKESWRYWTRPLWETQPKRVMVILEKDALSRLFVDVCDEYRVNVYPTRGYGSYTYVKNMALTIDGEKPTVILYFGDYDPSGRDIERDISSRLERYGARNFIVKRVALTPEQIKQYNLPPKPEDAETIAKLMRDPRTKTYGMDYACELDALEPNILQEMIRKAIEAEIDKEKWNERVLQIVEEKNKLKEKLSKLRIEFE